MPDKRIPLPKPHTGHKGSLEAALANRRSLRKYSDQELDDTQISQLLWAAQGITGDNEWRRTAPSAGGFHPLTLYALREDGVWRYVPSEHVLVLHSPQDLRADLAKASWHQQFIAEAPCVFVFSAIFERTTERYGDRGKTRYVPMDIGHAAQNMLLQAVAMGLASVPIGAFDDDAVLKVLDLPSNEEPLYIVLVGYPA